MENYYDEVAYTFHSVLYVADLVLFADFGEADTEK